MKNKRLIAMTLISFLVLSALSLSAVTPIIGAPPMRLQGVLKDAYGTPLNGAYSLIFRLYSADTGGMPIWEEMHMDVNIEDGILDIEVGSIIPIELPFDSQYWLGVEIEFDGEMTPRFKLNSVPYSFSSERFVQF